VAVLYSRRSWPGTLIFLGRHVRRFAPPGAGRRRPSISGQHQAAVLSG